LGLFDANAAEFLSGTTNSGESVTASGLFETNYVPSLASAEPGVYGAYHCRDLTVSSAHVPESASYSSSFALTNLTLGADRFTIGHPATTGQLHIVADYRERIKRLKALRTRRHCRIEHPGTECP
jgi:hypothetical protein